MYRSNTHFIPLNIRLVFFWSTDSCLLNEVFMAPGQMIGTMLF